MRRCADEPLGSPRVPYFWSRLVKTQGDVTFHPYVSTLRQVGPTERTRDPGTELTSGPKTNLNDGRTLVGQRDLVWILGTSTGRTTPSAED